MLLNFLLLFILFFTLTLEEGITISLMFDKVSH